MNAPTVEINPVGLEGIDFVEFASPNPNALEALFLAFGFSKRMRHERLDIDLFQQNDITFLLNREPHAFAATFQAMHGPSIVSMGWRVADAHRAHAEALRRGAVDCVRKDAPVVGSHALPAVFGIGESAIHLVDRWRSPRHWDSLGFVPLDRPVIVEQKGFIAIDHLTNNVRRGSMQQWANFYKNIFNFTEVRYFDIRGVQTGLTSYALRSPDGSFCIPINEGSENKSQINEYLEEYNGPGIQHLAFLTHDILASLRAMDGCGVQTLDIDDDYYSSVFERVHNVREDRSEIRTRNVLVDGDDSGYLLQIFTKNVVGPIFIEIIQRNNHRSFGEGNFSALFRSIERDQARRGYLDAAHT